MNLIQSYKNSLKNPQVEEILDLLVFRPLAFLLVLILYRFPITPNQITFLAMITGILSGYYYSFGDSTNFAIAAFYYGFSNVLDCSDGMIARIKKNGTKVGRIIDGMVDYIVSAAVYIGLANGLILSKLVLPYTPWTLVIIAALSAMTHAVIFDYYRNQFLAHAIGEINSIHDEIDDFSHELERLRSEKSQPFNQMIITAYLAYCRLQRGSGKQVSVTYNADQYFRSNKLLLRLWSFIGSTSHISVLIIASLLYQPMIFFYYVIVFGNTFMIFLWIIQVIVNKRIALDKHV